MACAPACAYFALNVMANVQLMMTLPSFLTQFRCERSQIQVAVLVVMVVVSYCKKNKKTLTWKVKQTGENPISW